MTPNCPLTSDICGTHDFPENGKVRHQADSLNAGCFCISLDRVALRRSFESELDSPGLAELVEERCPYVFSARPVFVSRTHIEAMQRVIRAVEEVTALPAYREHVLADAPAIARHIPAGTKSVFFGYDFHVGSERIGLIEVNTNAGGAMLNAKLARAQQACCEPVEKLLPMQESPGLLEQHIVDMFSKEWKAGEHARPLKRIAIVDTQPEKQYLYPEFILFQRLFEQHGWEAVIADPSTLTYQDGLLLHEGKAIDLVYNRLTDFSLEEPASTALRDAYLDDAIVLTPHPQAHALYANKRNLALLCDDEFLSSMQVPEETRSTLLSGIPRTVILSAANADQLWRERRKWFFKPNAGFGSRAAYRGDKLTKRVWEEILRGGYIAQEIIAPGERLIGHDEAQPLKFDIRNYVYDGEVQWTAARLYQGQTTNFRTPGGGFAPVYSLPETC